MQECTERYDSERPLKSDPTKCYLVKGNIIPLAFALFHPINRLLENRSTTQNALPVWAVKCSLEMETPTHLLNAPNSTGRFTAERTKKKKEYIYLGMLSKILHCKTVKWNSDNFCEIYDSECFFHLFIHALLCSGHCFCQGVVSARSASPLTKSSHMVALVSFPPHAGGRRGLTVATDFSHEKGAVVTVTGWVFARHAGKNENMGVELHANTGPTPSAHILS